MLKELIKMGHVNFYDTFSNWEDAVRAACHSLVSDGSISPKYVEQIIANINKYGPYIVIADNIAIPHARGNPNIVYKSSISLTKLRKPVEFKPGDDAYNAILLFTLASADDNDHIENMKKLSNLLMNETLIEELKRVNSFQELFELIQKNEHMGKN